MQHVYARQHASSFVQISFLVLVKSSDKLLSIFDHKRPRTSCQNLGEMVQKLYLIVQAHHTFISYLV